MYKVKQSYNECVGEGNREKVKRRNNVSENHFGFIFFL